MRCGDGCEFDYPALARVCSVYLHADWPDEYETDREALDAFVTFEPDLAARLPAEVEAVLERFEHEGELVELLVTHLGCAYWPYPGRLTYRQWLEELSIRVVDRSPA